MENQNESLQTSSQSTSPQPPNLPSQHLPENKPQSSFLTSKLFFITLVLVILFAIVYSGIYLSLNSQLNQITKSNPTPTVVYQPTPTADPTVNWKTYMNQSLGFSIKYPNDVNYTVKERDTCIYFGVPETDNTFSVCRYMLNSRNLEQWLKQETVSPNPSCQGLYGTCGETALNYEDLKLTNVIVNNYKAINVEQTENSYKTKYNGIRTPKVYIFITNNSEMFEIDGNYSDQILSTFKFTNQ